MFIWLPKTEKNAKVNNSFPRKKKKKGKLTLPPFSAIITTIDEPVWTVVAVMCRKMA